MLTFLYDHDGLVDRISCPPEPAVEDIVFRRVAAGDVLDLAFRQRCVGTFVNSGQTIEVTLDAAGGLMLAIAGQPSRRLTPHNQRTFAVESLVGYTVEFCCGDGNAVDALVFHQPNGTFLAQRLASPTGG